jgi:nitrile hydratase
MAALFDYDENREAASAAEVRALEALLIKKGVLGSGVDAVLNHFETVAGPFNGARIVARAWLTQPSNVVCWRIRRKRSPNFNFRA